MAGEVQNVGGLGISLEIDDKTDTQLAEIENRLNELVQPRKILVEISNPTVKGGRGSSVQEAEDKLSASLRSSIDKFTSALADVKIQIDPQSISSLASAIREALNENTPKGSLYAAERGTVLTPSQNRQRPDPRPDARLVAADAVVRTWEIDTLATGVARGQARAKSGSGAAGPARGRAETATGAKQPIDVGELFDKVREIAGRSPKKRDEGFDSLRAFLNERGNRELKKAAYAPGGPMEWYEGRRAAGFRTMGFAPPNPEPSSAQVRCDICGRSFSPRGFGAHRRSCERKTTSSQVPPAPPIPPTPEPTRPTSKIPAAEPGQWASRTGPEIQAARQAREKEEREEDADISSEYRIFADPRGRMVRRYRSKRRAVTGIRMRAAEEILGRMVPDRELSLVPTTSGALGMGSGDIRARIAQESRNQAATNASRRMLAQGTRASYAKSGAAEPAYQAPPGGVRRVGGTGTEGIRSRSAAGIVEFPEVLRGGGQVGEIFRRVLEEARTGEIGTAFKLLTPEDVAEKVPGRGSPERKTAALRQLRMGTGSELLRSLLGPAYERQVRMQHFNIQGGPLAGQHVVRVNRDQRIREELALRLGLGSVADLETDENLRSKTEALTDYLRAAGPPRQRTATQGMALWQRPPSFAREEMPFPIQIERPGGGAVTAIIRRDRMRATSRRAAAERQVQFAIRRRTRGDLLRAGGKSRSYGIITPAMFTAVERTQKAQAEGKDLPWDDNLISEAVEKMYLYQLGPIAGRREEQRTLPEVSATDMYAYLHGGEKGPGLIDRLRGRGYGRASEDKRALRPMAATFLRAIRAQISLESRYRREDTARRQGVEERKAGFVPPVAPGKYTGLAVPRAEAALYSVQTHPGAKRLQRAQDVLILKEVEKANAQESATVSVGSKRVPRQYTDTGADLSAEAPGRGPSIRIPMRPAPGFVSGEGLPIPKRMALKPGARRGRPVGEPITKGLTEEERARSSVKGADAAERHAALVAIARPLPADELHGYRLDEQRAIARETETVRRHMLVERSRTLPAQGRRQRRVENRLRRQASRMEAAIAGQYQPVYRNVEPPAAGPPAPPLDLPAGATAAAEPPPEANVAAGPPPEGTARRRGRAAAAGGLPPRTPETTATESGPPSSGAGGVVTLGNTPIDVNVVKSVAIKIENPAVIKETVKAAEAREKAEGTAKATEEPKPKTIKTKEGVELTPEQLGRTERARQAAVRVGSGRAEINEEQTAQKERQQQITRQERSRSAAIRTFGREEVRRWEAEERERKRAEETAERERKRRVATAEREEKRRPRSLDEYVQHEAEQRFAAEQVTRLRENVLPLDMHSRERGAFEVPQAARMRQLREEVRSGLEDKYARKAHEIEREVQGQVPAGKLRGEIQSRLDDLVKEEVPLLKKHDRRNLIQRSMISAFGGYSTAPTAQREMTMSQMGLKYGVGAMEAPTRQGSQVLGLPEESRTRQRYMALRESLVARQQDVQSLPLRALSTSVLVGVARAFGPYESIKQRQAVAAKEANAVDALTERRVEAFQVYKARREYAGRVETAMRTHGVAPEELQRNLEILNKPVREAKENFIAISKALRVSEKRYAAADQAVMGATDSMRHYASAFVGGIAGGFVGAIAGMVSQPLIQAFGTAVEKIGGPIVDQALGFSVTRQRTIGQLAEATAAAGGMGQVALAQQYQFIPMQVTDRFKDVTAQAETISAAKRLEEVRDLYRTQMGLKVGENGEPLALTTTQGPLGNPLLADYKSIAELIGSNLTALPTQGTQREGTWSPSTQGGALAASELAEISKATSQINPDWINTVNDLMGKGSKYRFREGSDEELKAARQAMVDKGLERVANAGFVAVNKVTGDLADTGQELVDVLSDTEKGISRLQPEQLIAQTMPQIQAQISGMQWQRNYQLEQINPLQRSLNLLQNPLMPIGTGIIPGAGAPAYKNVEGLNASMPWYGQAMGYTPKGGMSAASFRLPPEAQRTLDQYKTTLDSLTTDIMNAAGSAEANMRKFGIPEDTIQSLTRYSSIIGGAQARIADIQTGRSESKYAHSIYMANRALTDAKQLTGQIGRISGSNVGYYERQLLLINRQNQALSLQLQKRQILTQLALARFQVPGETGEERYARRMEAEIAAGIQQKQLGLAQAAFGTEIKLVDEQNLRAVQDAAWTLKDLQADYAAGKETAILQQVIERAQTALQGTLMDEQTWQAYLTGYDSAMASIAQDLAAKTGQNMTEMLKIVKTQLDSFLGEYGWIFGQGTPNINAQTGFTMPNARGGGWSPPATSSGKATPQITQTTNVHRDERQVVLASNAISINVEPKTLDEHQVQVLVGEVTKALNQIARLIGLPAVAR